MRIQPTRRGEASPCFSTRQTRAGTPHWMQLLAALPAVLSATTAAHLALAIGLEADLLDYELPKHPVSDGRGHLGALIRPSLLFRPASAVEIELGAIVRLPF